MRSIALKVVAVTAWITLGVGCGETESVGQVLALKTGAATGTQSDPVLITAPGQDTATIEKGQTRYYRVAVPPNHDGLRLAAACQHPVQLWLRRGADYASSTTVASSLPKSPNTLFVPPEDVVAADDQWWLVVKMGSGWPTSNCTVRVDDRFSRPLTWDPGTTAEGEHAVTQPDTVGGDYLYEITAKAAKWGAWRHALRVTAGQATLYADPDGIPSDDATFQSLGSKGVVVPASHYQVNARWFVRVRAYAGAQWSLVSGDLHVTNLGPLEDPCCVTDRTVEIGPEKVAWFRTTVAPGTLAWMLATDDPQATLYVDATQAPVPGFPTTWDTSGDHRMLVVPGALAAGDHLVAVASPNETVTLRSYRQEVRTPSLQSGFSGSDEFTFTLTGAEVGADGYAVYRVDVPVNQLAWQVRVESGGQTNVYVRGGDVPNETHNHALSEVAGGVDSTTQVPPTLSNGTSYVTVTAPEPTTFTLHSGTPEVTDIPFVNANGVPNGAAFEGHVGWRFFRVTDVESQLGSLGWLLELANQAEGTEIAIRKNAAPARWSYRSNGKSQVSHGSHLDASNEAFLERPNHTADVWYVGVHHPTEPLGAFELFTRTLTPEPLALGGVPIAIQSQPASRWQYFTLTVPDDLAGVDIRIEDVQSGDPEMVIRRDGLPAGLSTTGGSYPLYERSSWGSGDQWHPDADLTGRVNPPYQANQPSSPESGRRVSMGMGSPLSPGTYYVGVTGDSGPMSYTVRARGIGDTQPITVSDLAWNGGSATVSSLTAREIDYYRVQVPAGAESWKVSLIPTSGEVMMALRRDALPNSEAGVTASDGSSWVGTRRQKKGVEYFYKYPGHSEETLTPGTWYIAVASEGVAPYSSSHIGKASASYTLTSHGAMAVADGGSLGDAPIEWAGQHLEFGEQAVYQFHVPEGATSVEVQLNATVGAPSGTIRALKDGETPFPSPSQSYRASEGGSGTLTTIPNSGVVTLTAPQGTYRVVVSASAQGTNEVAADYTLRVVAQGEAALPFNGGNTEIVGQEPGSWRYFTVVVPEGALGWDLRLEDVTSGAPELVVSRDEIPSSLTSLPDSPSNRIYARPSWSPGHRWHPNQDLTGRTYSPGPSPKPSESGRRVSMGMGSPLEPGTYIVGVTNASGAQPMSYTLRSRGIGIGDDASGAPWAVQVQDLPFGQSVTGLGLAPREIAYYRLTVPEGLESWQVTLTPTAGEAMMALRRDALPNSEAGDTPSDAGHWAGARRQKAGAEYFYKHPGNGETTLAGGTWYIAVASEGKSPTSSTVGSGAVDYTLASLSPVPVAAGNVTAGAPLEWTQQALAYGQQASYEVTVPDGLPSLEIRIDGLAGHAVAWARQVEAGGSPHPSTAPHYRADEGGQPALGNASTGKVLTIAEPSGTYRIVVAANRLQSQELDAQYHLRIVPTADTLVAFNGGAATVTGQDGVDWKYFKIVVPEDALGWDLRLDVSAGEPRMSIGRDTRPVQQSTTPKLPELHAWPSEALWYPDTDLSGRAYGPPGSQGTSQVGRRVSMGMGSPLVPGTYYVGVRGGNSIAPMSYTLVSRGIGVGNDASGTPWAVQVTDLAFDGGAAAIQDLAPREIAYYRVEIPAGTPSWHVSLDPTVGEAALAVRWQALPNVAAGTVPTTLADGGVWTGIRRQKEGRELYYRYPSGTKTALSPGTWYLAVVSEGQDPTANTVGAGAITATLTSHGEVDVAQGPSLALSAGEVFTWADQTLEYGAQATYRVRVPDGALGVQLRLEAAVGEPTLYAKVFPYFAAGFPGSFHGPWGPLYDAGEGGVNSASSLSALQLREAGDVMVTVAARGKIADAPAAEYTLVAEPITPKLVALDGGAVAGALANDESDFYRVEIPALVDGAPIAGWLLGVEHTSGATTLKVRQGHLPNAPVSGGKPTLTATTNTLLIVPPVLTPGTWFIEVQGTGLTEYTLSSTPVRARRTWHMPAEDTLANAPGVPHPQFGDSGVDDAGQPIINPVSSDQGTDLAKGYWHFYRVEVPEGNGALLRTRLDALSGNPDLYVRRAAAPTTSHRADATSGWLRDYADNRAGTSYGLWVPKDLRYGMQLEPGTWWVGVTAPDSTVRYRLRLGIGLIEALSMTGGTTGSTTLAASDMRYYRVQVPQSSEVDAQSTPLHWKLTLSQQLGDVDVFLREHRPPGLVDRTLLPGQKGSGNFSDWLDDNTYLPEGRPALDLSGTTTLNVPPVQPGVDYYLGVYAVVDAVFVLKSDIGDDTLHLDGTIPWTGGTLTTDLAAGESRLYRIDVPAQARRWVHTATHAGGVRLKLHRATVPGATHADWTSGTKSNASLDQTFYDSVRQWNYPWAPGNSYYLRVENTTSLPQPLTLATHGKDLATDDADGDTLPDWWEWEHLGNTGASPSGDHDGDGLSNQEELDAGTDPSLKDTDGDGLDDGLEIAAGTDPHVTDSDDDGVPDGVDVFPADGADAGRVITLSTGQLDNGQYGGGYGLSEHPAAVEVTFQGTAERWLHVQGWDVDAADEVAVYLNDVPVGHLPVGADSADSRPAIWWFDTGLKGGTNRVRFVQKTPGEPWGVSRLGLYTPSGRPIGYDPSGAFGTLHPAGATIFVRNPGAELFELRTFDVEAAGEVTIELNGQPYADLPASGAAQVGPVTLLVVGADDFQEGWNALDIIPHGGDGEWSLMFEGRHANYNTTFQAEDVYTWILPRTAATRQATFRINDVDTEGEVTVLATAAAPTAGGSATGLPPTMAHGAGWASSGVPWISKAGVSDTVRFQHHAVAGGDDHFGVLLLAYGDVKDTDQDGVFDDLDAFTHVATSWSDEDQDGIGDQWELAVLGGLSPADASTDADGEVLDLVEFAGDTDPLCSSLSCPGETCANARPITELPFSVWSTQKDKANDLDASGCTPEDGAGPDMVWSFTPESSMGLRATFKGLSSHALQVRTDCASGASAASCPAAVRGSGSVEWFAEAGTTYYLVVDGRFGGSGGPFALDVIGAVCDCEASEVCTPDLGCVPAPPDTCADALDIEQLPFVHPGDTTGLAHDVSGCNLGGSGADAVYRLTAPVGGTYVFSLETEWSSQLYLLTTCGQPASCLAGTGSAKTQPLEHVLAKGQTVLVAVDAQGSTVKGKYTLRVEGPCVPQCGDGACGDDGCGGTCGCPPGASCNGGVCQATPGDSCGAAIALMPASAVTGDTEGLTDWASGCGLGAGEADLIYAFTAPETARYTLSLNGDGGALYALADCADPASCTGGGEAPLALDLTAGETRYVVVDGAGSFQLSVSAGCGVACDGKSCGDDGCGGTCGACAADEVCTGDGQCECVPQCDGKSCGDDGCGGACGVCDDHEVCSAGQCECAPACDGKACGADGCGGTCGGCGAGEVCTEGQCECVPACDGKVCGDDGCGGTCGVCPAATPFCSDGACVALCTPSCAGKACGDDGCGGSCGTCGSGQTCSDGQCVCVPSCAGKACGDDGCGGSCGPCDEGETCTAGQCVAVECATPSPPSEGCTGSEPCVCLGCQTDGVCGQDDCVCPDCLGDASCAGPACAADGVCDPFLESCDCPDCKDLPICDGAACVPTCDKACGSDGCGGSCGSCNDGDSCTTDLCGDAGCEHTPVPGCCHSDADCAAGETCESETCVEPSGGDVGPSDGDLGDGAPDAGGWAPDADTRVGPGADAGGSGPDAQGSDPDAGVTEDVTSGGGNQGGGSGSSDGGCSQTPAGGSGALPCLGLLLMLWLVRRRVGALPGGATSRCVSSGRGPRRPE